MRTPISPRKAARSGAALLLAALFAAPLTALTAEDEWPVAVDAGQNGIPAPEQLEEMGARIGRIILYKENVFDTSRPGENKALFRLANRWHIITRDSVIRQQLLFREGDRFSARLMRESARLLRRNHYLYTAEVEPIGYSNGEVDIGVRTRDLWTLMPGFSVSRKGGENKTRVSLSESNLLGRGAKLKAAWIDDVDRTSTSIEYSDTNLGHSWVSLVLGFSDKSDGNTSLISLERPFFSLDSRWTAGFDFLDDAREERLYDLGDEVAEYEHETDFYRVFGGWSAGLRDGWVRRWTAGFIYENQRFSEVEEPEFRAVVPEDRRFVYPFLRLDILEDRFETTRNRDQIARTEDFYLGRQLSAMLGYAPESLGSHRNAVIYDLSASQGFGNIRKKAVILSLSGSGRVSGGSAENTQFGVGARYYNQISGKRLFFTTLDARWGHRLDLDNPIELGGDNGLRGYPLRYQAGDGSVLLTIEERYYTDWYPFRLFRVGAAVFADVGRTFGENPVGGESLGWLKDVGIGLRFAPTRGGANDVVHFDIAFPLDGDASIDSVQVLLESKRSF